MTISFITDGNVKYLEFLYSWDDYSMEPESPSIRKRTSSDFTIEHSMYVSVYSK